MGEGLSLVRETQGTGGHTAAPNQELPARFLRPPEYRPAGDSGYSR